MEKLKLEKVIEKLEQLDAHQWTWGTWVYRDPTFTAKVSGLIFSIDKYEPTGTFKAKRYHSLTIADWEEHAWEEYHNTDKNSFEEKEISKFYNKLHERLKTHRVAEFSDMLDEFLSEKTDYKVSMEKPEFKKVLAKLEQLDSNQWKMRKEGYGSKFTTTTNGLTFCLSLNKDVRIPKSVYYHELTIKNREGNTQIIYADTKKDSLEEREISRLYEKLRMYLENDGYTKFTEILNTFLSE
jgi:hypothetical protein